jgi:hypothetical protein
MFTNIFDILEMAGMPDPRKNEEFRQYLLQELQNIENGDSGSSNLAGDVDFDSLTTGEKANFVQKAQRQVENNPSKAEKLTFSNKLIELYQQHIDIKKVLKLTPKEITDLKEIPLRR